MCLGHHCDTEVILRTINHALLVMTKRTLADFRVEEKDRLEVGEDLRYARLPLTHTEIRW